jgi:hypothetical protein
LAADGRLIQRQMRFMKAESNLKGPFRTSPIPSSSLQFQTATPGRQGVLALFPIRRGFRFSWALGSALLILTATLAIQNVHAQGSLTNGVSQDGAISTAGETNSWTTVANQGDRVTVQIAKLTGGAAFRPTIEVISSEGLSLGASSGAVAARVDLQAGSSGTLTVKVSDAHQTGTGTYRLQFAHVPGAFTVPAGDEGGALTNGFNQLGTIDLGDLDLWSFSANAGDRIALQIAKLTGGAGFAPLLELFGPDGRRMGVDSGNLAARVDAQIETGGTYTVLVSARIPDGTGNYQLQLAQVPGSFVVPAGDEGGALSDGVNQDGAITPGDLDLWTFATSPGDHVTLQITKLTGGAAFTPKFQLYASDGSLKATAQGESAATIDTAIYVGGTCTLLVSDATKSGSGTYQLHLTRGTTEPPGTNVLSNGATALGSISPAGREDRWTFPASIGESIVIRAGETVSGSTLAPQLRLYNPDGVLIDSAAATAAAEVSVRATNSGTFTVSVRDNNGGSGTGNYRLSLAKTGSPVIVSPADEGGVLTNGVTYLATIETGDIDAWTFTANAGENIIVRMGEMASSTLTPYLRLYGPDGVLLSSSSAAVAAEVTTRATNSGTFLVVAGDFSSGWTGTGNYRLSLAKTGSVPTISPSDEGGALTNGTTFLATIATGDIDSWTFIANAGESIVVRMGELGAGTLRPQLRLYDPDGALLDTSTAAVAAEVTVRATNSGTFLVVAGDLTSGWAGAGDYRLTLAKTGSPLAITSTDEGGALTNGTTYLATIDTGDIDAWTFTASAGDSIIVRMGELGSGTLKPQLRLYGPDGVLLDSSSAATAAEVTVRATNSGTFLVVVGDLTSGWAGTGNYRLSLAKTGSPLSISPTDEGGPLVNGTTYLGTIDTGDIDPWTFTASAGDGIIVRMGELVSSALTPHLRLYGPDGVLLDSSSADTAAEVTIRATNSGTFLVVADDLTSGWVGTGNYRLSLAKTGSPIVVSAGDEGGPMTGAAEYEGMIDPGDIDTWNFTACAGDVLSFQLAELVSGSSLTPWIRLYGRDGTLLKSLSGSAAAQFTISAPANGTYMVVVSDLSSGWVGSGTYRLVVNGLSESLKVCIPTVSGNNVNIVGVGGIPGATFVLFTSTNIITPLNLWTPIQTNQFDQYGAFVYTNYFSPAEPRQFFLMRQ